MGLNEFGPKLACMSSINPRGTGLFSSFITKSFHNCHMVFTLSLDRGL